MNTMYTADGGSGGARKESTANVYDPKTGTWVKSTASNSGGATSKSTSTSTKKTPSSSSTEKTSISASVSATSKTLAEKEYIDVEFNTLTGELSITPTEKSIRIKVNDTVKLEGLGKYLSGQYYVSQVRRTITKEGG